MVAASAGWTSSACDRVLERVSAPVEDARELAGAAAGNEQGGRLVPDRHDHRGGVVVAVARRFRLDEGAQQAQCLEVEASSLIPARCATAAYGSTWSRGATTSRTRRVLAVLADALLEHPVVEHRLGQRDGKHLVRLEPDGVVEAALVLDAIDVQRADADAVAREPDANVLLRQLLLVEEQLDGVGERAFVPHLAVDDEAGRDRPAGELEQLATSRSR